MLTPNVMAFIFPAVCIISHILLDSQPILELASVDNRETRQFAAYLLYSGLLVLFFSLTQHDWISLQ
jgi:hypothetical protein